MIIEHKTLSCRDKVIFEKIVMGHFDRVPKLFQETEACFMYIEEGSFRFRTPESLIEFNAGDGLLAKCGDYFFEQTKIDHRNAIRTKAVGVYLYPSIVKELFNFDLSLSDFATHYDATKVNMDQLIRHFMAGIEHLLDNPSVSSDSMILAKLKEFLLLLSKTENAPSILDFASSLFRPYEYDFKRIVDLNTYSNLSVQELAYLCGMSLSSFQRKFNEVYSQTPAKHILLKKMERAADLLKNKNKRISDIAYDSGFDSISTFNRLFKKHFNISPSKFRMTVIGQ